MVNVYLTKQNSQLCKKGKRLIVKNKEDIIADIPLIKIEQVIVLGSVGITGAMIQLLLKEKIPITYLSYYGKYMGRLVPEYSSKSILRIKQFKAHENKKFCLTFSKEIVKGKVENMKRTLLRNLKANNKDRVNIKMKFNNIVKEIKSAKDIKQLMGYEGLAAKYYFSKLDIILNDEFKFMGRNKRPPKDPVNSMLSFGYSLLLSDIITSLYISGFDPYIGFYHSVKQGKVALALDLIEEFRQTIVDSIVKTVINKRMVNRSHFINTKEGVFFVEKAKKVFIEQYKFRLNTEIVSPLADKKLTWRQVLVEQANLLSKVILGEEEKYNPMVVK